MNTTLASIQNFLQLSPTLATAGQPAREQFAAVKQAGFDAVINLATSQSWDAIPDEAALWQGLGIEYHHIPVEWEAPQAEDLQQFMDLMDRLRGKAVFVHCARNMRVSAFIFLYRVLRRGEPADVCWQDVLKLWQPNDTWQEFISAELKSRLQ